jgi:hypothetical protein
MDEKIGYCGYDCSICAARSDDDDLRQKLVEGWKKIFGHEMYTSENVRCDGCRGGARHADTSCEARPCAESRGVPSCALCDGFVCDKVRNLLASREGMMIFLRSRIAGISEEEYELCVRQFESMPRLLRILVDSGRLPGWAAAGCPADSPGPGG